MYTYSNTSAMPAAHAAGSGATPRNAGPLGKSPDQRSIAFGTGAK